MTQENKLIDVVNLLENKTKIDMFLTLSFKNEDLALLILDVMEIKEDDELRHELSNEFFHQYYYYKGKNGFQTPQKVKDYLEDLFVQELLNILPDIKNKYEFGLLEYQSNLKILNAKNLNTLLNVKVNPDFKNDWINKLCEEFDFKINKIEDETLKIINDNFFNFKTYTQEFLLLNTDILKYLPKNFISKMNKQDELSMFSASLIKDIFLEEGPLNSQLLNAIKNSLSKKNETETIEKLATIFEFEASNILDIKKIEELRKVFPISFKNMPTKMSMSSVSDLVDFFDGFKNLSYFLKYLIKENEKFIFTEDIEDFIIYNLESLHDNKLFTNMSLLAKLLYVSDVSLNNFDEKEVLLKIAKTIENNKSDIKEYFFADEKVHPVDKILSQLQKYIFEKDLIEPNVNSKKIKI